MVPAGRAGGVASREVTIVVQGTIVRLIHGRGFGFIRPESGQAIFFHHSTLPRGVFDTLRKGQRLEFDIEHDPQGRGERAANVRIVPR